MIPTITTYLYILHHEKAYLELQQLKRKAMLYSLGIIVCLGISALLWILR